MSIKNITKIFKNRGNWKKKDRVNPLISLMPTMFLGYHKKTQGLKSFVLLKNVIEA